MILGVIDQAVAGKDDAHASAKASLVANVTLVPAAAGGVRQKSFPVAKAVAANAHTGGHIPEVSLAADPPQLFCFGFGQVVGGKMAVGVEVKGDVLLVGILTLLRNGKGIGRFRLNGRFLCLRVGRLRLNGRLRRLNEG